MTQTEPDPNATPDPTLNDSTDTDESRRQRAEREQAARNRDLENVMLRAGLDPLSTDAPMNKLFFEGYKGDITNEAVIEAAKGYGLIKPEGTPANDGNITDPNDRQQTGERQAAATGLVPDGQTPTEDPRIRAVKIGEEVMAEGGSQEGAMGRAFDEIAAAGFGSRAENRAPDPRAQWDPDKQDPRRQDLGW